MQKENLLPNLGIQRKQFWLRDFLLIFAAGFKMQDNKKKPAC
jgi:hypothetical protein